MGGVGEWIFAFHAGSYCVKVGEPSFSDRLQNKIHK